jgi:hypothetical protein
VGVRVPATGADFRQSVAAIPRWPKVWRTLAGRTTRLSPHIATTPIALMSRQIQAAHSAVQPA